MMLSRSSQLLANGRDIAVPISSDSREAVKSPVNPMDFSTLVKQTWPGLQSLEQARPSAHKDGA